MILLDSPRVTGITPRNMLATCKHKSQMIYIYKTYHDLVTCCWLQSLTYMKIWNRDSESFVHLVVCTLFEMRVVMITCFLSPGVSFKKKRGYEYEEVLPVLGQIYTLPFNERSAVCFIRVVLFLKSTMGQWSPLRTLELQAKGGKRILTCSVHACAQIMANHAKWSVLSGLPVPALAS